MSQNAVHQLYNDWLALNPPALTLPSESARQQHLAELGRFADRTERLAQTISPLSHLPGQIRAYADRLRGLPLSDLSVSPQEVTLWRLERQSITEELQIAAARAPVTPHSRLAEAETHLALARTSLDSSQTEPALAHINRAISTLRQLSRDLMPSRALGR